MLYCKLAEKFGKWGTCNRLSIFTQMMFPRNGPSWILAERLRRIGWIVKPSGLIQDCFGEFNVFHVHWNELFPRFEVAWSHVLACEVGHRTTYQGLHRADIASVKGLMKQFGEADQDFIACALNGELYTDIGKSKDNRGSHTVCQHCGQGLKRLPVGWHPAGPTHVFVMPWMAGDSFSLVWSCQILCSIATCECVSPSCGDQFHA